MADKDGVFKLTNNRFNVSLSAPCMEMVNAIIENGTMFNGRSDFVFSAIRHFYIECNAIFIDVLEEAETKADSDLSEYYLFSDSIRIFAKEQDEIYRTKYPGPMNKQIPIRPSDKFFITMCNMCGYLTGDTDYASLQMLCRIAIMRYIDYYCVETAKNKRFTKMYDDLKTKIDDRIIVVRSANDKSDWS